MIFWYLWLTITFLQRLTQWHTSPLPSYAIRGRLPYTFLTFILWYEIFFSNAEWRKTCYFLFFSFKLCVCARILFDPKLSTVTLIELVLAILLYFSLERRCNFWKCGKVDTISQDSLLNCRHSVCWAPECVHCLVWILGKKLSGSQLTRALPDLQSFLTKLQQRMWVSA